MKKSLASMCLSAVLTVAFSYHAVAADLPEIEKSGTLKVATEDDYAPFNFMNNGQADGFNKDMLEELRKYAKFHVDQSILPWTGLLAAVSTGQYDMALTGAVITDERLKVFDFTPPWASAQHYFVKRAGDTSLNTIADLSGKKVGVQAGSALLARLPELKAMLDETFVMIHRSYLVNIAKVDQIRREDISAGPFTLPVARSQLKIVNEAFIQYNKGTGL